MLRGNIKMFLLSREQTLEKCMDEMKFLRDTLLPVYTTPTLAAQLSNTMLFTTLYFHTHTSQIFLTKHHDKHVFTTSRKIWIFDSLLERVVALPDHHHFFGAWERQTMLPCGRDLRICMKCAQKMYEKKKHFNFVSKWFPNAEWQWVDFFSTCRCDYHFLRIFW